MFCVFFQNKNNPPGSAEECEYHDTITKLLSINRNVSPDWLSTYFLMMSVCCVCSVFTPLLRKYRVFTRDKVLTLIALIV